MQIHMHDSKHPTNRSVFGLKWLIFFLSNMSQGYAPFLSIYLKSLLGWSSDLVGMALGTIDLSSALSQIPTGLFVDASKHKRLLILIACAMISISTLIILYFPSFETVILSQSMVGISSAIFTTGIGAITLGLFKRELFPKQVSINETWGHAGSVLTASCVGLMGYWLGLPWLLYMVIVFAMLSIWALKFINPNEINHDHARELVNQENNGLISPLPIHKYLKESLLLIFCGTIFLFNFANAAQLPLIGQVLSQSHPAKSSLFMAGCIVVAQVVMIGVAYRIGFLLQTMGRKPIFLIGFAVLPIRAFLFTLTENPLIILLIQIFDGVGGGILGVMGSVIIADISKGTGRFNFSLALMILSHSLGASASNLVAGVIAHAFGFQASFLTLACIALIGISYYAIFMPETKEVR